MPTTYAHYSFGERVRANLHNDVEELIRENLPLYQIGQNGPDILFYHSPLRHDPVNELGHEIHRQSGLLFFSKAKSILMQNDFQRPAIAYVLGVLCHFMLDTQCHPSVRQMESEKFSHNRIEAAFDRVLMERDGLDPMSYRPTQHIKPRDDYAAVISQFYDGVSPKQIKESLLSMRRTLNLFVSPGAAKRFFVVAGMKLAGQYEALFGLLMEQNPDPGHAAHNRELLTAYDEAVPKAVIQVNRFYKAIIENGLLDPRLDRNFG